MKKMWGGRFSKELDSRAKAFSYSLSVDRVLFPHEIRTTIAHVKTLARARMLSTQEANRLVKGLKAVEKKFRSADLSSYADDVEDVHTFIQREMETRVGVLAKKMHTGRSRNDQVATSTRLYCKDALSGIMAALGAYQKALVRLARKGAAVIIPGYTHLQRAQVVLLTHHLLAYVEMAERDLRRMKAAFVSCDELPLGSGALAGVSFPLDRAYTARLLGFGSVAQNSIDAVSARDYLVEILSACAIVAMHLSRLSEDMILWSSQEFGFVEMPESFATGSSIMPHKKNADMFELIRGRTGKLYGNLTALLVTMKGLPLAYNRDMQEDKGILFSSVNAVMDILTLLAAMIPDIIIRDNACMRAAGDPFLFATDIMDYLIRKGMPMQEAHTVVGKMIRYVIDAKQTLAYLTLDQLQQFSPVFDEDYATIINAKVSLKSRKTFGSTHPQRVEKMLACWEKKLRVGKQ